MQLSDLQSEQRDWEARNFDLSGDHTHRSLLGLVEEVGELSHAHLKFEQRIRNYDRDLYFAEARDAVGDIVIYLAGYCNRNGIDLDQAVTQAWNEVKARDWVAFPKNGVTE